MNGEDGKDYGDGLPVTGYVDFAETEPAGGKAGGVEPFSWRRLAWLFLLPLGFVFFLTCLFLAMRGVMDLGGFVASGGPYEIAHEAPDWWWIFPLSIIGCISLVFASFSGVFMGGKVKSSLVALFFWPAIFLSLGWNFFEYGFFNEDGLVWGWIICAALFLAMGGLPLFLVLRKARGSELREKVRKGRGSLWPQLAGAALGVPCGIFFFAAIS